MAKRYLVETIGPNGAVTNTSQTDTLPAGMRIGEWQIMPDGGRRAIGTAPVYLHSSRRGHSARVVGRARVAVWQD